MISAGISPANAAPTGISVASPPVLVEGGHSPLDVQGTGSGCCLEAEEEENAAKAEDVDVDCRLPVGVSTLACPNSASRADAAAEDDARRARSMKI